MPAVQSSFQSESRLEPSSNSSSGTLLANFCFGLLAFIVVAGIRCLFKLLRTRWKDNRKGLPQHHPWKAQDFSWATEKSRVVSTRMSASTAARPYSSQGSEDGDANSKGLDEKVAVPVAEVSDTTALIEVESTPVGPRPFMVRPPPPLPLTPPQLSTAVFAFDDRRRSFPAIGVPRIDTASFIHQPNPDYIGESTSTAVAHASTLPEASSSAATPRRRSYTRTVPIGIPNLPQTTSPEQSEFSPSSFPLASPSLPPPAEFPEIDHSDQQEIDVHGEIISALDEAGHGWKRHTRVYGGGVCLACLNSGGEGGFYGENVRPEDRRYH